MDRVVVDGFLSKLRNDLAGSSAGFPLDEAVTLAHVQADERERAGATSGPDNLSRLLMLFDVTSASAALAIKKLGKAAEDASGIRDALVDLWGRAEAARCLLFDAQDIYGGAEASTRILDLWETARLLAPDAIAIAMRLSEPVSKYVEFVAQVLTKAPVRAQVAAH